MSRAAPLVLRPLALVMMFMACSGRPSCNGEASESAPAETSRAPDPALPGLGQGDTRLMKRLRGALAAKGPEYEPRTRHRTADGGPEYINRLILETSPYLLQHAHNPVNWFPWGEEAFERAKRGDRPILLSVGYSTCHWCHVMERESFEDEEIARFINENFIPIKVDREQRPDLDQIYMKAVQMLTGRGGWPMTVFLTPERQPFFAGTYFPARDGDRGAETGFLTILQNMAKAYAQSREQLMTRAHRISRRIQAEASPKSPSEVPGPELIDRAARSLAQTFDPNHGGFGAAPKFPRPSNLDLLLRYHRRTGDPGAKQIVLHTLDNMARGGIHDQIGGGFHRYATDARWLVPHFEKMLYDNAQLVSIYLAAYQVNGRASLARTARQTLDYVQREMTAPDGGFYSATDADSPSPEGAPKEGRYFTWTPEEIEAVLGPRDASVAKRYYGVTQAGDLEGRNILHRPSSDQEAAEALDMTVEALRKRIARIDSELLHARSKRPAPHRDDKILTAWNGLMISAFARGGFVLDDPAYTRTAKDAAEFVLDELRDDDGRLLRSFKDDQAQHNAYLDDYAFLIRGLLDLYEASSEPEWIEHALQLQRTLDRHYWDEDHGGYFITSDDHETLLTRAKPIRDGAEPSGNAIAILNLIRLAEFTTDHAHRKRAERALAAFAKDLRRSPRTSPKLLSALEASLDTVLQVLVVTPGAEAEASELLAPMRTTHVPNHIFAHVEEGSSLKRHSRVVKLLQDKKALQGRPTAYVCEQGRCELPTSEPEVFAQQLLQTEPLLADPSSREPLQVPESGSTPSPWTYDEQTDRHWHPGHRHWHQGPPPDPGDR